MEASTPPASMSFTRSSTFQQPGRISSKAVGSMPYIAALRGTAEHGRSVGADSLIALTGFAPPTLHALGARAASSFSRRLFNVVVTNVPGPQVPLYAAGARMTEMFPVVPLAKNQALSIGVTSYDGGVYFGLNADRDAMSDVDVLAAMVEESVEELMGTVSA